MYKWRTVEIYKHIFCLINENKKFRFKHNRTKSLKDKEKKEEKNKFRSCRYIFWWTWTDFFSLNITIIGISSSKIHLAGIFYFILYSISISLPWTVPTFSSHVWVIIKINLHNFSWSVLKRFYFSKWNLLKIIKHESQFVHLICIAIIM